MRRRWQRICHIVLAVLVLVPAAGVRARPDEPAALPPSRTAAVSDLLRLSTPLGSAGCPWIDPALRDRTQHVAAAIWRRNVSRRYALVHPSGAYSGVWLRDSFWTLTAIGDPQLAARSLRWFAERQRRNGQLPTQFTEFIKGPLYKPDESTLLFLIWSAWQSRAGGGVPSLDILQRALNYVRGQAPHGLYRSQGGTYASWFDSLILPRPDTISYNQGLYVDALLAARVLGLAVPDAELNHAIAGYRGLVDAQGYLRFSQGTNYHEVSGLVGEFVAEWLFQRSLLPSKVVARTLETLGRFQSGFRIITDAQGDYLPPRAFVLRSPPGDYQNGGSWLLYDYIALAVGYLHGLPGEGQRMHDRLALEYIPGATFHEYMNTNPQSRMYGHEPRYRDNFSWDTFVVRVDAIICARA